MPGSLLGKQTNNTGTPDDIYTEIIDQWELAMDEGEFPRLGTDSHWITGKARLTTFRSEVEWLVIFEELTYYLGLGAFSILVYGFGNRLRKIGFQNPHNLYTKVQADAIVEKTRSIGLGVPFYDNEDWLPDLFSFDILLGGKQIRFSPTKQDYADSNIDLDTIISGDRCLDQIIGVFRWMCDNLPEEQLFFPNELLLEYVNRPLDLPLFLQLKDWCHPGSEEVIRPSQSPCLKSLAMALADNDPKRYICADELVNTHWSNWLDWLG